MLNEEVYLTPRENKTEEGAQSFPALPFSHFC